MLLAEVLRQQSLEEGQRTGTVGQRVEKFHRKTVMIDQYPQGALAHLAEGGVRQGAALFLLYGGGVGDLLQIVPEHAAPQPHSDGGEAPRRHIQRGTQHRRVHRLGEVGGDAEEVVPMAALGGGVDLGGIVQLHPAQASGRGEHLVHEVVDGLEILSHILVEAVQHVGVPPLRRHDHPAAAAALQQLFVEHPGVVQHDLVPAHEQQRRGQTLQVAEQRRAEGVGRIIRVALGVELQQLRRHGGVDVPVGLIGRAGAGEIRPGGDAHQTAGQGHSQHLQLQTQGVDQSTAGAFAAQQDLPGGVALFQQVPVALQRVVQRRRVAVFRRQTVGSAEHPHAALRGQRGGKALGVFQTAAGVAAAVEIQHHAAAAFVPGHDPGTLKGAEVVLPGDDLPLVERGHQFAQFVLPLAGHLQRAVGHKGLEEIQL